MSRGMTATTTPWLGDIPTEWGVERCKYNFSYHKDVAKDRASDYERLALTMKGVIKRSKDDLDGLQPKDFEGYQIVNKGDLVFKLIDLAGVSTSRVGLSAYDGLVSPAYILMHADESKISKEYATYFFLSMWHRLIFNEIGNGGIRSALNSGDLLEVPITKPPISEQHAIVRYLDSKCSAIDEAIEKHKKIIEKLEEAERSIVFDTITHGLNKDIRFKKTSIRWAQKIPEHWTSRRIKYTVIITNGSDPCMEGDTPVYGSGAKSFKTCGESKKAPTVLLGRKGATLHIPHYIDHPYWNVDTAFDTKPLNETNMKWFYYVARCLDYKYYINTTTLPSMTQTDYGNMAVPTPPIEEQADIASFLDEKTLMFQNTITSHQQIIIKLEEYRKSIIYNAVTGKIDCRKETAK